MPGKSSNEAWWFPRLEPSLLPTDMVRRADDPRLGELIEHWDGELEAVRPGRAVLIGFPQEEGVRGNHGRTGAAHAPRTIRHWLCRLTPWDGTNDIDVSADPPLDAGDVRITGDLEKSQRALAEVVAGVLKQGGVPIILGGGHETAYGSYLGYVAVQRPVAIINLDAHLDVRPTILGKGHSGSPFRQALEHPTAPLPGANYVCLGAQPSAVSQQHLLYARERGCTVRWAAEVAGALDQHLQRELDRFRSCAVHLSIDADVVHVADVPGVSAPNVNGLSGSEVLKAVRLAGESRQVTGMELVEVNPTHDRDDQSSRWAALAVWHFLMGLAKRPR